MQGELLLLLALHLVLTALPGVAASLYGARLGVRQVPVLLAIALAATGAAAMGAFWAYYADRTVGQSFSFFLLFGSVMLIGWSLQGGRIDRGLLGQLAAPLALWGLGSAFLVFLGFVHGDISYPVETAAGRFYGPLPSDNDLPRFFAEWFYANGHAGDPVYPPDWLASDRPPLQIGFVLAQRPFGIGLEALNYQVLGVILQQLWIVGLWALLTAARLGRSTRALVVVAVLLSGLAIVNGFFVWPKLLPAAMLLAAAALVITPLWDKARANRGAAVLLGLLVALAMMGHGSSVFGVIPLALIAAVRGLPSWRWIGIAALVAIVVMAPWTAYQKYDQPPGDRLLKWSLAGVTEIDERGTVETIVDSYREAGFDGAIHNKGQNFVTMVGGGPALEALDRAGDNVGAGKLTDALREVRTVVFFDLFPSLGLLLLAPVAMALGWRRGRRRPEERSFALLCFAVVGIGCVAWGLLAFGDLSSRTVLHVSSYLLPILLFSGAVAGLRAVLPRFAVYYTLLASALMLALYVPVLEPLPGNPFSVWNALLAALALAGFGAVAFAAPTLPEAAGFPPDGSRDRPGEPDHGQDGDDVVEDQRAVHQVQVVGGDDRTDRHGEHLERPQGEDRPDRPGTGPG